MIRETVHRSRLPWLLAGATLLLSWLATLVLWDITRAAAEQNLRAEFESRVHERVDRIGRRMGVYEQILRSARGFLRGAIEVPRDEYRTYVSGLNLDTYFPGIQGIGVAQVIAPEQRQAHVQGVRKEGFTSYEIWPSGERALYTAITRIEPFNAMNRRAFGYDMYSEPVRRAAMEAARDSGRPALSGKVTLVQESDNDVQPGFLMYLPVYAPGAPTASVDQRRAALSGWVYAPFRIRDFMRGIEGVGAGDIGVTLYDGTQRTEQACLLGCAPGEAGEAGAMLQASRELVIAGRPWLLDIRSTPVFEARMNTWTPRLILAGGLLTGALLAALFWILASARARALEAAAAMTSELRTSHARIEADQRRMRSILESSYDAFVAVDEHGVVTDWNAAAQRLFGWKAQEAIGEDLASLIFGSDRDVLQRAGMGGNTMPAGPRLEVLATRRDGALVPAEMTLATLDADGGHHTTHAFIRDLSEQKAGQQREARRQKALEEARAALQHAQRLEAIGKLTGGVAHDFNNVLQIISGNIQLLQHFSKGERTLDGRLDAVMQAVERGAKLSSQLLSFARRQPLRPQVIEPRRLLAGMQELIQRAVGDGVEVEIAAAAGLWNTSADPNQLENVILNLAINARDAMHGAGRLTIELGNATLDEDYVAGFPDLEPGQFVMLAISDTGAGMTPEVMEQAFEPFFTTKPRGEGTGLGLSMAYGFVKQSGGHIRLYSEAGHGTTVRIYLPRSFAAASSEPERKAAPAAGGSETVLVVEDDEAVRAAVAAMLSELGYRVLQAGDGDEAMRLLERSERGDINARFDLLFTDVVMPGEISSTELARRAKLHYPQLAVLFTSGYTQNAIVHGGRLDPGVQLLSKPYRREELARKVRQVLDAQRRASDANA